MTTETQPVVDTPIENKVQTVPVLVQEAIFMQDCIKVILTGGIEKFVSISEFVKTLNETLGQIEETKMDGFSLPSNVFYLGKNSREIQLSCYYGSKVSNVKYYDKAYDMIMPNIIISHVLTKKSDTEWSVSNSKYFCTDLPVSQLPKDFIYSVNHSKRIYLFPMSNTYNEANMCYGGNSMPKVFKDNNLRGLDWYYQFLFESPFNNDLGLYAVRNFYVEDWYALLTKNAKDGKPFPYEHLRGYTPR